MRLERHPELLERLAADYLTGGMGAGARRRYEALLGDRPELARALEHWRTRLDQGLLPERTPEAVWEAVQRRIDMSRPQPQAGTALSAASGMLGWGLRAWRGLALGLGATAAVSLALLVALLLRGPGQAPAALQLVAVLDGPAGHAAVLQVRGTQAALTAVGAQAAPPGKSFELWVLPRQGKPIAAGVVTLQGTQHMPMPPRLVDAAVQAKGFAISVEPLGGSPTGQPTGPVTYVGRQLASASPEQAAG
jgi:anti-sigma-K factor RskA